ncbi:MAG: hypothetical protein ACTTKH_02910 [Treponema sp.]
MVVSKLVDIERKESHIYYMQDFTAMAVYSIVGKEKKGRIAFSIEHKPTGEMVITVRLIDDVDYPLLPVIIDLKKTIKTLIETNVLLLD